MTFQEIRAGLSDRQALFCTLVGEAAGEPVRGQVAVACTIRNRVRLHTWMGKSFRDVCLHASQYSCWWERTTNTERLYILAESLLTKAPLPPNTIDAAAAAQLRWIADGVIAGDVQDETHGATHYLTTKLFLSDHGPVAAPWAFVDGHPRVPCATIGAHTFFRDIP